MYTNVLTLALSPPEVIDLTAVTSVFMIKNREESFFFVGEALEQDIRSHRTAS